MSRAKPFIFIALLIAFCALSINMGWLDSLANGTFTAFIEDLRDNHWLLAAAVYLVVTLVCCVVFALPGVLFALTAGIVFGALWGTVLCWIAVTAGACFSFFVGRYFLKESLKPRLQKSTLLNKLLFEEAHKSDVYLLALTRLIPLFPYNLQNFAYGITDIKFSTYAFYSALFMIPGTAAYTFVAAGIIDERHRALLIGIAILLIGATLLVAHILKRKEEIA